MRYLIPLLFIALVGAGIYFVNKTTPLIEEPKEQESLSKKAEKVLNKNSAPPTPLPSKKVYSEPNQDQESYVDDSNMKAIEYEDKFDQDIESEEMTEYLDNQDMIEEEYKEEVSDDDFNEFLSAAQEEIMDDPEIAEAIIGEMGKIYKVQPDHQQKIIRFYEECAGNSKLPEKIRNLCDKERYATGD